MSETFKGKVTSFGGRTHIEIPQIYQEDFPKGTIVSVSRHKTEERQKDKTK